MHYRWSVLALTLALTAVPRPVLAAESYDNCTGFIDTLPATISTQGTWCLRKDLSTAITSGNAITIKASNVTVDCNDFKIGGLGAGIDTLTVGIDVQELQNVTVRNCRIRGFWDGIFVLGETGGGHLVENNRLEANTRYGMYVQGDGSRIERNLVRSTGGGNPAAGSSTGIVAFGSVDIVDNTVSGVTTRAGSDGWVFGIGLAFSDSSTVRGNRVRGLAHDGTGLQYGIRVEGRGILLSDNEVVGPGGLHNHFFGISCADSTPRARSNSVMGFEFPLDQCTDSGGNDLVL